MEHPAIQARKIAQNNLKKQAEKMLKRSRGKLQQPKVGDCVAVFVSEFDRGRGDPANLVGKIIEIKNDKYKIGTKGGMINNWLERNCFEVTKFRGLQDKDIPKDEFSLREIVRKLSVGNGQGYKKCTCKGNCTTLKCKCFKCDFKCNSACHSSRSCQNHD